MQRLREVEQVSGGRTERAADNPGTPFPAQTLAEICSADAGEMPLPLLTGVPAMGQIVY